jgi:ribose transport system permease protein
MKKSLGILGIFVAVCLVAAIFGDNFLTGYNLMNLTQRSALFAILSLGAGLVIVTGGIDLSIGSVVCLSGIMTPWLLVEKEWTPMQVIPTVLAVSAFMQYHHSARRACRMRAVGPSACPSLSVHPASLLEPPI